MTQQPPRNYQHQAIGITLTLGQPTGTSPGQQSPTIPPCTGAPLVGMVVGIQENGTYYFGPAGAAGGTPTQSAASTVIFTGEGGAMGNIIHHPSGSPMFSPQDAPMQQDVSPNYPYNNAAAFHHQTRASDLSVGHEASAGSMGYRLACRCPSGAKTCGSRDPSGAFNREKAALVDDLVVRISQPPHICLPVLIAVVDPAVVTSEGYYPWKTCVIKRPTSGTNQCKDRDTLVLDRPGWSRG
jgi:hypothetical protein